MKWWKSWWGRLTRTWTSIARKLFTTNFKFDCDKLTRRVYQLELHIHTLRNALRGACRFWSMRSGRRGTFEAEGFCCPWYSWQERGRLPSAQECVQRAQSSSLHLPRRMPLRRPSWSCCLWWTTCRWSWRHQRQRSKLWCLLLGCKPSWRVSMVRR